MVEGADAAPLRAHVRYDVSHGSTPSISKPCGGARSY